MLKTLVVLPDGTEIFSGPRAKNAILGATLTECVNEQQELTLGSCCSNMFEAKIMTPGGGLEIAAGDELTVYKVDDNGDRHKVGLFTTEQPVRSSANTYSITAYDRVSWLDKDLTLWLAGLGGWPYPLYELADMVCAACKLDLLNTEIPNGDYLVQRFSADGTTGRQLMKWIGQIAGRFCRATADGRIEFAWYEPLTTHEIDTKLPAAVVSYDEKGNVALNVKGAEIIEDGAGNVALDSDLISVTEDGQGNVVVVVSAVAETIFYYQNGLSYEDYSIAPIEKVQLRQNEEDVGTIYPPDETGEKNTYSITGNYLLTASTAEDLLPVAKTIYEGMQGVAYTPCKVSVPASLNIRAGHIVKITDRNGRTITAYVMTKTQSGQRDNIECTGSSKRDSSTAVNNQSYQALTGKVLNLRTDVEGLKLENADAAGRVTKIEADLSGIRTQVSGLPGIDQRVTELEQSADGLQFLVRRITEEGASKVTTETGYTFNQEGLRISKSNEQMENLLDNKGMYVKRGNEIILQADAAGVNAIDITVRNYLVVGAHARFEDYSDGSSSPRTACFWI